MNGIRDDEAVQRAPHQQLLIANFVDGHLLRSAQTAWPVAENGRALGVIAQCDVATVPEMKDEPLPVVEGGTIVGLLLASDIFRWLSLHRLHALP